MRRYLATFTVLAALGCGSKATPTHSKVGVAVQPPPGRVIGFDPSVVGLPGAIGDTVYDSAGIISWVKYGASNTAWRPIPISPLVTGDPSQAPGLKAPIGFVVTKTDGSQSWIKSSASDTGWVANPSGGGVPDGGVAITTADGGGLDGNGTPASPLSVIPQYGPDTKIGLANSSGTKVTAWEGASTLTTNTAGSEASEYVISLLSAGAPVAAQQIFPGGTVFPDGSIANPSVAFAGNSKTGLSHIFFPDSMYMSINGAQVMAWIGNNVYLHADASAIVIGTATQIYLGANGLALQLYSNLGDEELGVDGATSTSATTGFVQWPSCAGTPTGVPGQIKSGHIPTLIDSTNKKFCGYFSDNTWHCIAFP